MKILFLQNIWREYFGFMHLASVLRQHHHAVDVRIFQNAEKAAKTVDEFKPDLVGFSFTNCEQQWVLDVASLIKSRHPNLPIVVGGPHPTLHPEIVKRPQIDYLVRGEGEQAIVELTEALSDGGDLSNIENLCFKRDGEIVVNPVRPLLENLDTLPFPYREGYYKYKFLRNNPVKFFFIGRGCPYNCSFCFNHQFRDLYPNKKKYIRTYSVERAIAEMVDVRAKYPMRFVRFEDDVFTMFPEWLEGFLDLYVKEINLPYLCYIRAGISEDVVRMLKESGCYCTLFGVETGDERRRNEILNKGVKDSQIFETAALLHKYRIHFFTTNMLGLPGETFEDALKTIRINQKIKAPDVWCAIFQPYPGLRLTDYAIEKGYLDEANDENVGVNTFADNVLKQPDIERIFNLHKFFYPLSRWPWLEPVVLPLTKLPANPLFHYIFVFFYVISYWQHTRTPWRRIAAEGLHWFRVFLFDRVKKKREGRGGLRRRISNLFRSKSHETETATGR